MLYLMVMTVSLVVSWSVWAALGLVSFDPFDDTLKEWVGFFVIWPGTLCGLLLGGAACIGVEMARSSRDRLS